MHNDIMLDECMKRCGTSNESVDNIVKEFQKMCLVGQTYDKSTHSWTTIV